MSTGLLRTAGAQCVKAINKAVACHARQDLSRHQWGELPCRGQGGDSLEAHRRGHRSHSPCTAFSTLHGVCYNFAVLEFFPVLRDLCSPAGAQSGLAPLKREGVLATMFCSHWFITLFAYTLPFDHLLRVWDVLFLEGPKIIFRCARAEHRFSLCAAHMYMPA